MNTEHRSNENKVVTMEDLDTIIEHARQISVICCKYKWEKCPSAEQISNAAHAVLSAIDPYYKAEQA